MANERRDNLFQAAVTAAWNKYLANNNYIPNDRSTFKENICPNTSFISNNGYELKTKLGHHVTTIAFSELEQCLPRNVTLADISTDNNNAVKSSKHFAIQKNINDLKAAADKAKSAKNSSSSGASSHIKTQPIKTASLNDNSSESQYESNQYSTLHPSRMSNVTGNDYKHAEQKDLGKKTANQIILDTDQYWGIPLLLILPFLLFALVSPQRFLATFLPNSSRLKYPTTYDQKIKPILPTQPIKQIVMPEQGLLNAFMGCVKGHYAYNSEYCKKHKKDLNNLDNATKFKIGSYIASLSGVRIMGYYEADVNLRLKAQCSKEPTLEGIYSYIRKEIMLCTNNMVGSGRPTLTLQHELVHAAQDCNGGPLSSSPLLKRDFLSGPLLTDDLNIVKEKYPKGQWEEELEARRGVTSGLLIDTAVLVYRACV